jgi:hypothetical protein
MSNGVPNVNDFNSRRVTNPSQSEVIRQRLFDYQLYPTAGVTQLAFFQQPIGQGITTAIGGTVGTAKTQWDTNQELGGNLPSGKAYMAESIEVLFFPGSVSTANTYTPAVLGSFLAVAASTYTGFVYQNDVNSFYQSGLLEFNLLSKNYLRETPLAAFPPKTQFEVNAGISTNSATTGVTGVSHAKMVGRAYYLEPQISIQPTMNYEILLRWPAAVATPSGFNARVGVVIDGFLMRASQ